METKTKQVRSTQSSITTLALAFFSLTVVALLTASGLHVFSSFQAQKIIISSNQQLIAQETAQTVSDFVQEKLGILETAVWLTNLDRVSVLEQKEILSSLLERQPAFCQLALFDAQGQALTQAWRLELRESRKLGDRIEDTILGQNPQTNRTISPVYIDPVTSEPLVMMTVPIIDVLGDFKGILLAELNLEFMWDLIDRLQVGQKGHAYVVDRGGNLLAFGDMVRVLQGENMAHLPTVREFIDHPASTWPNEGRSYRGIMGTMVVGIYAPLETPDWAVVTELPWIETYQSTIREAVWTGGITLGIATLAGLLGGHLGRRLTVLLANLTGTATQIAAGKRKLQAVVEGPREVADLASAFNSMTAQLHQSLEQQIIEQKQAEEALRGSEERLRLALEGTADGIWDWNPKTGQTYFSPHYYTMMGYEPDEFPSTYKSWRQLRHPDDMEASEKALQRALAEHAAFAIEFRLKAKNGEWRWILERGKVVQVDAAGQAVRVVGSHTDITDRKRMEEALEKHAEIELTAKHEAESKFSDRLTTLATITNELSKAQTLDELYRRSVEAGREQLGFDRIALWFVTKDHETMLGTYGTDAEGHTTDEQTSQHAIPKNSGLRAIVDGYIALKIYQSSPLYQDGEQIGIGERLAVGLWDGETVIGFLSVDNLILHQPFTDQDCKLLRLYAVSLGHLFKIKHTQDKLTQLAETLEQRVIQRTTQLEAANKELEAFSYSVSHDLRAPLRHIDGFTRLLLQRERERLDPTSAHYLDVIAESVAKMGQLIDNLLTFSRLGRSEMRLQRVELDELVEDVRQNLLIEAQGRQIDWKIDPLPAVKGDPALLRQLWINLLSNALKYTTPREQARIEVRTVQQDANSEGENNQVTLLIRDNGVGFDPQYAHKLFGVFQRLHRAEEFEGTGIGLAIVRRIVHRHDGQVWAEGAPDHGATFYLTLQAATQDAHHRQTQREQKENNTI